MWRRIAHRCQLWKLPNVSALTHLVLHNREAFAVLINELTTNVSEMFRNPAFFLALRHKVLPYLASFPHIRCWVAGCANGEEAYSLAILLQELGIYNRAQIYATDLDVVALQRARDGIYPVSVAPTFTHNYQQAGGTQPFSDYYRSRYDSVIMDESLKKNILFSQHNLVTDGDFNEMHLITCRNVLIYFRPELQSRVLWLFYQSLFRQGVLALGSHESLQFQPQSSYFESWFSQEKIYRKIR